MCASIFLDFNLPNAATWFYFSLLLSIALFFKFSRPLSVRNLDVLTLFLLVPGLLLLQDAHERVPTGSTAMAWQAVRVVAGAGQAAGTPGGGLVDAALLAAGAPVVAAPSRLLWFGYLWLLCGTTYLLIRCLLDLALVQRPALTPNLNLAGLAWLAGALFVCLVAVAVRRPEGPEPTVGRQAAVVSETQRRAEDLLKREVPPAAADASRTSFWVGRILAMTCHLAVVIGLIVVGCRHYQDATGGMAAATFYLLLPYTAFHVGQLHHAWPAAFLVWAVAAYRLPVVAGVLLGLAAGSLYFPVLLFPVWLSFYRRRGAGRFAAAFFGTAGLCLGGLAALLWIDGQLAAQVHSALSLTDWQPWVAPSANVEGFWTGVRWAWAYRLPVFVVYLAFLVITFFWPSPKNLAHVLTLSCAVLLGVQLWYADRGGVYVLWYLPLLLLLVFRPNLSEKQPPLLTGEADWLVRLASWIGRAASRLLRPPQPTARVH
jgi:hypothetical protein